MISKNSNHFIVFILSLIISFNIIIQPTPTEAAFFANGADVSWLPEMESSGYKFYNDNGSQQDCLQILKDHGINSIRLRVWVNPANNYYNKNETVKMAVRAKNMGFRIMIDFHYSDYWADPGNQKKPSSWESLDFNDLMKAVYDYTYDVMNTLKSNGVYPEWVQVGNETNNGMLWNDGMATNSMKNFAWLINCGYDAVKAVNSDTKVIVHLANGYDNVLFRWIFDGINSNGAKYDVIGMSLYPTASDWSDLTSKCLANMEDMVSRYGKEVMICEVGMDSNIPETSKDFIADIIKKTKSISGNKGLGVFYWEPQCYNWQQYGKGAFDLNGKPTAAMDAFLLYATTPTLTPKPTNTPIAECIYGDVSGDRKVDSADYTLLRRYLIGIVKTLPASNWNFTGDINVDGKIDSADFTLLRRYLIGIIPKLPV